MRRQGDPVGGPSRSSRTAFGRAAAVARVAVRSNRIVIPRLSLACVYLSSPLGSVRLALSSRQHRVFSFSLSLLFSPSPPFCLFLYPSRNRVSAYVPFRWPFFADFLSIFPSPALLAVRSFPAARGTCEPTLVEEDSPRFGPDRVSLFSSKCCAIFFLPLDSASMKGDRFSPIRRKWARLRYVTGRSDLPKQ